MVCGRVVVEKLRIEVDIVALYGDLGSAKSSLVLYCAAPKRTETNFDTPGSCMVTP
jgi:tRNA A37 threonylcarbamoyladenosine biosynthesis protein TsaE